MRFEHFNCNYYNFGLRWCEWTTNFERHATVSGTKTWESERFSALIRGECCLLCCYSSAGIKLKCAFHGWATLGLFSHFPTIENLWDEETIMSLDIMRALWCVWADSRAVSQPTPSLCLCANAVLKWAHYHQREHKHSSRKQDSLCQESESHSRRHIVDQMT